MSTQNDGSNCATLGHSMLRKVIRRAAIAWASSKLNGCGEVRRDAAVVSAGNSVPENKVASILIEKVDHSRAFYGEFQ